MVSSSFDVLLGGSALSDTAALAELSSTIGLICKVHSKSDVILETKWAI